MKLIWQINYKKIDTKGNLKNNSNTKQIYIN